MSDPTGDQLDDDRLRALLQSRDPAASLSPADQGQVTRLLEDTMSHDVETPTHDPSLPEADPRRRTPLTWLLAAAAVLVIAGVGAFAILGSEDQPTATPPDPVPASVLELTAPPPTSGRCAMVTTELLRLQETAFEGTVTSINERLVTLEVGHWYRGGDTDLVTVEAPPDELSSLILAVRFEKGQRYLVSANDGAVTVCGFSAPYDDDLAALYERAFSA